MKTVDSMEICLPVKPFISKQHCLSAISLNRSLLHRLTL